MARLIDADKLIMHLTEWQLANEAIFQGESNLKSDMIEKCIRAIQKQPTSKGWISVEDRKPASQDDKILMVVDRNGSWSVEAGIYINKNGIDYWCGERGFLNSLEAKVIKWQYFPKP